MPMCWISRTKPKKSRAIRDIPVYKILRYDPTINKYISPIMDYIYEFGEKEESILDLPKKVTLYKLCVYSIDKGFHSYRKASLKILYRTKFDNINHVIIGTQNLNTRWTMIINKVYQSQFKHHVLCSAHIPKGASYYLNECGEYVSDTLVIDKVLDVDKELKTLDIDKRIRARILKRSK